MSNNGTTRHQNPFKGYEEGKNIGYLGVEMLTGMTFYMIGFFLLVASILSKYSPAMGSSGSVGMAITGGVLVAIGIFFHFLHFKATHLKYSVVRNYFNEDGTMASELRNSGGETKVVQHGTTTSFWKNVLAIAKGTSLRDLLAPKMFIAYFVIAVLIWANH
jgi:hypothetical protein